MAPNTTKTINTIIVGGGHGGVNLACWLEKEDPTRSYLILEKADVLFPQWKYARWEKFQFNTPVRFSALYGEDVGNDETLDRPLSQDLERWSAHVAKMKIKHQLHATVQKVEQNKQGDFYTTVCVTNLDDGTHKEVTYISKNVVCANGCYNTPKRGTDQELAEKHPEIKQLSPMGLKLSHLNPGGVLIVGGGQSGVQLADLFADSEHSPVAMCTSKINGSPRTYRGRDVFYWMEQANFISMPKEALKGMPPPQAEGLRYGHNPITGCNKAISHLSLFRKGVQLLGGLESIQQDDDGKCMATIKDNRSENCKSAIEGYNQILGMICIGTAEKMEEAGQTLDPHVPEEEWQVQSDDEEKFLQENGPLSYNLSDLGITNIIWATGFGTNFDWLDIPQALDEFDKRTKLPDTVFSEAAPGLFFTGFPWIGNCQSQNLVNMDQDDKVILQRLRA